MEMEISVQPSPIIFRVKCIDGFLLDINTNSPILRSHEEVLQLTVKMSCLIFDGVRNKRRKMMLHFRRKLPALNR
ncbi:hypothetical protein OUZ56_015272 [Daphnia magna]|uniref:Uncharacterized protein n=1 Tax=Daphnia magna TaxID=35525 RepID=A0ABR0AMC3_9CRUS|nr:hypothetical protein OUZ56_015272 [Daphnia magna]